MVRELGSDRSVHNESCDLNSLNPSREYTKTNMSKDNKFYVTLFNKNISPRKYWNIEINTLCTVVHKHGGLYFLKSIEEAD
jgi:hypothetical protein